MSKFKCSICGYVYDEAVGIPQKGVAPGTRWEDIPGDFACPVCTAPKSAFKLLEETGTAPGSVSAGGGAATKPVSADVGAAATRVNELSAGEVSAICSSLAKGCEKQRLTSEMEAFNKIADYFKSKAAAENDVFPGNGVSTENDIPLENAVGLLDDDLSKGFAAANAAAKADKDRGALRSLVWSEKVSTMAKSLADRYAVEGDSMFENTKIYVCDICGFIYVGDAPPEICPVCKVPNFKILPIERR